MTAGRAAADASSPHLLAIALMAAVAVLVPMIVFGSSIAFFVLAAGAVPAALFLVVRHPRTSWLLMVAGLPITMTVPIATTRANLSIPLEVLAGFLAPLLLFALLRDPRPVRRLLLHPLSIALGFQLAWMTAATFFSTDPTVSIKALAVRVVYLTVFYLGGFVVLDRACKPGSHPVQSTTTAVLFLAGPTALWALARHAPFGFARRESYEVAQPFFSNHTEYATVLVVWLCLAVALLKNSSKRHSRRLTLLLSVLGAAVVFAGARSAWIALLAALATLVALQFKPNPRKTVMVAALIMLVTCTSILGLSKCHMEGRLHPEETALRNRAIERLLMFDLLVDESSLERLNRWHSAARMLRDRLLFGFGPATYEKTYGRYQQHQQLTRVSTFKGDRGDAHSEFMTVAAEHGFGGLVSLLAVMMIGLGSGANSVRNAATSRDHWWAACWTAVFVAIIVSCVFNSLLELDKTAPLFWLAAAVLVHLDLKSTRSTEHTPENSQSLVRRPAP
jgi:O-antigen ligase